MRYPGTPASSGLVFPWVSHPPIVPPVTPFTLRATPPPTHTHTHAHTATHTFSDAPLQYKEDMRQAAAAVPPGAESSAPPLPPLTKEGMLRVKPIRDWAKAKPADSTPFYVMTELEVCVCGCAAVRL